MELVSGCPWAKHQTPGCCNWDALFTRADVLTARRCDCAAVVLSGVLSGRRARSLNPPMKNEDFPPRRKCLLLTSRDVKALYCCYKYHNPLPFLYISAFYTAFENGCVSDLSVCGRTSRMDSGLVRVLAPVSVLTGEQNSSWSIMRVFAKWAWVVRLIF